MCPPPLPRPDILRPTEVHDFGDVFREGSGPDRRIVIVLALAGILMLGQFAVRPPADPTGGAVTAAAGPGRN